MTEETPKAPEGTGPDAESIPAPGTEAGASATQSAPEPEVHTLPGDDAPTAQPAGQSAPPPTGTPAPQPVYTDTAQTTAGEKPSGTAPLVMGILSIVLSGGVIGIILGILGITQGNKVLKADPSNGQAKAGKITGVVGLIFSILFLILYIAVFALGCSLLGGATSGAQAAADEIMAVAVSPSEEEKQEMQDEIESVFDASGFGLSDLGLTAEDFSSWLYDNASYELTGIQVDNGEAAVTYSVTSNKFEPLLEAVAPELDELDYTSVSSESEVYLLLGDILKNAMDSSTPTTKEITIYVSQDGTDWVVQNDADYLFEEIFYYE